EAEDVDDEDRRNPAEEVGVEHGEQPEREKHRPGQPPKNSDREGENEDQRLGGTEDPNVQQESVRDLRKRVAEELSVEESLPDLFSEASALSTQEVRLLPFASTIPRCSGVPTVGNWPTIVACGICTAVM